MAIVRNKADNAPADVHYPFPGRIVGQGVYTDRSISSLTGSSQTLMEANLARRELVIENIATHNIGINPMGGTAAIGTQGTITIVPGGSWDADFTPTSKITIIGTASDKVTAFEA